MITIYETGLVDFTDHGLVKPVRFTEDDLRIIASSTVSCDVTDEHEDTVLASINNFIVEDGCLKSNKPKDLDITGKGFSPVFDCEALVDMGDFYVPQGISMSSVGLTETPRNHILYNSIGSNGDKMTDDVQLRQALDDNRKLTEEIGELKAQVKSLSKKLTEKDDKINSLTESSKETAGKLKDYDSLVEKSKAYDLLIEEERKSLINDITGGDEKLAEEYSNFTTENLKVIKKHLTVNRKGRGVDPTMTDTTDGNNPNPEDDEDEYTDEMFEEDFKASGL